MKEVNKYVSEGEELIKEFLEEKGIKVKEQVKIPKLKNDYADYRVADFYLPQYRIYIEFLGKWNEEKHRRKYIKKKEVYTNNRIPCVYLYPDNLGILNFILFKRVTKVLKQYGLKWQLLKWIHEIMMHKFGLFFIGLIILIFVVKESSTRMWLILFGIVGYLYEFIVEYRKK